MIFSIKLKTSLSISYRGKYITFSKCIVLQKQKNSFPHFDWMMTDDLKHMVLIGKYAMENYLFCWKTLYWGFAQLHRPSFCNNWNCLPLPLQKWIKNLTSINYEQAEKLKSREMKDEWWRMMKGDEGWWRMMKDDEGW